MYMPYYPEEKAVSLVAENEALNEVRKELYETYNISEEDPYE